MNKLGMVLGLAAVATLAGCKDPDYRHESVQTSQTEVKNIDTTTVRPIVVEPVATRKCTCPPGTRHTSPCTCGDLGCLCIVETKPIVVADIPKSPAETEASVYVVRRGDYLAKISKKFNVTIASIKRLNPAIKNDVVRIGQKLVLPGKFDVGAQVASGAAATSSAVASAAKKGAKKSYQSYVGATKEYVVKNGDTLGSIAYGNGINIRQLKELNGLASDSLKIGQKLKIPAEKVAKAAKPAKAVKAAKPASPAKPAAAAVVAKKAEAAPVAESASAPAAEEPVEEVKAVTAAVASAEAVAEPEVAAPEAAKLETVATTTYVVQEGDDMTGVSIRWGVSAAEIRELNNLAESDQLVPGQIIKLPADAQQ